MGSDEIYPAPPIYAQNCHFQRRKKWTLFITVRVALFTPTNTTGNFEILKDYWNNKINRKKGVK